MTAKNQHRRDATGYVRGGHATAQGGAHRGKVSPDPPTDRQRWDAVISREDAGPLITRRELLEELQRRDIPLTDRRLTEWERIGAVYGGVRMHHEGQTQTLYPEWWVDYLQKAWDLKASRQSRDVLKERRRVILERVAPLRGTAAGTSFATGDLTTTHARTIPQTAHIAIVPETPHPEIGDANEQVADLFRLADLAGHTHPAKVRLALLDDEDRVLVARDVDLPSR
jgi:hypothetical protein